MYVCILIYIYIRHLCITIKMIKRVCHNQDYNMSLCFTL